MHSRLPATIRIKKPTPTLQYQTTQLNYLLKRFFLSFLHPFSKPKDENFTFQTSNSFYFSGRFYLFIKKERSARGESICKRQYGKKFIKHFIIVYLIPGLGGLITFTMGICWSSDVAIFGDVLQVNEGGDWR